MVGHFEIGQVAGYGFGLCMFIFFNAFALYRSVERCHKTWTFLITINIIAGIIVTPILYTIIIPIVYLIKSSGTVIKKSKKIDKKKIIKKLKKLNPFI